MMAKSILLTIVVGTVLLLGGCWGEPDTGPVDVRWDQEGCELCQMFISDARFVAEVRGGSKNKVHKFDDIGCAINWLNAQDWAGDPKTEIWVAAMTSTRENVVWLNAREARFVKAEMTPMDYGYGAVPANSTENGIDFQTLTTTVLASAPNHICKVQT